MYFSEHNYCIPYQWRDIVLILIVLDVLLWEWASMRRWLILSCLNPYCIGCTSLRWHSADIRNDSDVLILIVLDVLLWEFNMTTIKIFTHGLNPYCIGCTSLRILPVWYLLYSLVLILIVLDVLLWVT